MRYSNPKAKSARYFLLTVNYTLLLVNASVIGAIFIFFSIASESSISSSVFSMSEKQCSFGFSLDPQESQIAVVITVGILLVPFSLSSVLVLIHNKWANLLTAIGFAFITISASVIAASLACRLPRDFFLLVILMPGIVAVLVTIVIFLKKKGEFNE